VADDDAPPGVPEWVVTYGDMMSLLLTFFIMLVSLSEVRANKKFRDVLESLHRKLGYSSSPETPPGDQFPLNSLTEELSTLGAMLDQKDRGGIKSPQATRGDDLRIYANRAGRPLTAGPPVPFESGQAELTPQSRPVLERLAKELVGKPNKVEIRGHVEPATRSKSSSAVRKLCYERASAVLDALEKLGVERDRMRLVAFGSSEPLLTADAALAGGNDRVEVVLLDAYASAFVGPRDTSK
jgi:chemotaxis protein MotB